MQIINNNYDFTSRALYFSQRYNAYSTDRFQIPLPICSRGTCPLWWQVLNPSGVGVGLWAQISLKIHTMGPQAAPPVMIKKVY